jgi:hypothetical protein
LIYDKYYCVLALLNLILLLITSIKILLLLLLLLCISWVFPHTTKKIKIRGGPWDSVETVSSSWSGKVCPGLAYLVSTPNQLQPFEAERESVSRRIAEVKRNGESERRFIPGGSILLEVTQAMPARPSNRDRMRVKTLGSWVVKVRDRDGSSSKYLRIQSVPQWKHNTSPLQRSTG